MAVKRGGRWPYGQRASLLTRWHLADAGGGCLPYTVPAVRSLLALTLDRCAFTLYRLRRAFVLLTAHRTHALRTARCLHGPLTTFPPDAT